MEDKIKKLSNIYGLSQENFEIYYKKVLLILKTGKKPSDDKTITVIGGQSGAGKTRLIPIAKQELQNNAVIVDFDELRSYHPHYKEVSDLYPEITHRILHSDTERVKNAILENLRLEGYNVIYEGALRNTQGFLDFARKFKESDYNIKMHIMAVPKLESYGSTFVRYATDLLENINPRWVEKEAHDGSYEGVIRTVKAFIDEQLTDDISVFTRGGEEGPKKIYSTKQRQFQDASTAIEYGREVGRKKAVLDFQIKYRTVRGILEDKKPELLPRLTDWENLYKEESKYFGLNREEPKVDD